MWKRRRLDGNDDDDDDDDDDALQPLFCVFCFIMNKDRLDILLIGLQSSDHYLFYLPDPCAAQ